MAYADLAAELAGALPGLSPILAATFVRRAWREIRDEKNWAFKTGQAALVCPAAITTGTVARTQYSATLTCSAAATAALTPFVAGTPLLTAMQIRFAQGPLYRIVAAAGSPLILTVDRPVIEATNALATYSVYRAYVAPPVADFARWDSLVDSANNITIAKDRLHKTSVWFDLRDPQRTDGTVASYLGSLLASPAGLPLYELWPHPMGGQTFLATFRRTGVGFLAPADVQPDYIPDSLIMARAYGWHGYPWAQANKGRFPPLQKTDFVALIAATRQQYALDLKTIVLQDDDLALETVYNQGHWGSTRRGGRAESPIGDAKYWQNHPITW